MRGYNGKYETSIMRAKPLGMVTAAVTAFLVTHNFIYRT